MKRQPYKFTITLLFLLAPLLLNGSLKSHISVSWAKAIEGEYNIYSSSVYSGHGEHFFIAGSFEGILEINSDTLTAQDGRAGFIGKVDSAGQWQWALGFESNKYCHINSIKEGPDNNIYFTGSYKDTIINNDFPLTSEQYLSSFAGKLDANGQLLWLTDLGINSLGSSHFFDITINNNMFFATEFTGDIHLGDSIIKSNGNRQLIVCKLSEEGHIRHHKVISSRGSLELGGLIVIENDDIILGGSFSDKTYFDNSALYPEGYNDIFIMRMDSTFYPQWIDTFSGAGEKSLKGLQATNSSTFIAYGDHRGEMSIGTHYLYPEINKGLYLAQLDYEGNVQWQQAISGYAGMNLVGTTVNNRSEIYFLFNYRGVLKLNDDRYIAGDYFFENMLAKYLHDGALEWIQPAGNVTGINIEVAPESTNGLIKATASSRSGTVSLWEKEVVKDEGLFHYMELFDCDHAAKPAPLKDTVLCPGDILDAGEGFKSYLWNQSYEGQFFEPDTTGNYYLEITDHKGCVFRDTLYVEMLPGIEAEIAGTPGFCPGQYTMLDAGLAHEYLWNTGSTERYLYPHQAGHYSVTVTNQNQCADSTTAFVKQWDLSPIDIDDEIKLTLGRELAIYPGDFHSYLWSNGSTSPELLLNSFDMGTGTFKYSLLVTDCNDCIQEKNFIVKVEDSCNLIIYPNPGKDHVYIEYVCGGEECRADIVIADMHGRPVYNGTIAGKEKIYLHGLDAGTYLVRVLDDKKQCPAEIFHIVK